MNKNQNNQSVNLQTGVHIFKIQVMIHCLGIMLHWLFAHDKIPNFEPGEFSTLKFKSYNALQKYISNPLRIFKHRWTIIGARNRKTPQESVVFISSKTQISNVYNFCR